MRNIKQFIEEMNQSNSVLHKKEVLKKFPEMKDILVAIYDPYKQYYVTSSTIKKRKDLIATSTTNDIFELLTILNTRQVTGHNAIATVNKFIQNNKEYEDIIYMIIDKDLECRVGADIINKVYPNLVPTFKVALAESYKDVKDKINVLEEYYSSRKMNGCRCLTSIDCEGDIHFYSREGHEFYTLDVLKEYIKTLNLKSVVLDGEICLIGEDGKETFNGIMSVIRRKDYTIPNPKYLLFDCIPYDDFYKGYSPFILTARWKQLEELIRPHVNKYVDIIKQVKVESMEQFLELSEEATNNGWEGHVIRKDTVYQGKRCRDMVKVKKMEDAEFVVTGMEVGPFRIIEGGKEITIETLSAVTIEYEGTKVSVGSGFSLNERRMYYEHPELIIGKVITVCYFEPTNNKQGTHSLLFPTFKFNHGDRRSV